MPYVFSTLTADQLYTTYHKPIAEGAPPNVDKQVFIKGGANLINKVLVTPRGVPTEITDEQKKILLSCYAFLEHKKNGFVSIEDKKADADDVAANLTPKDVSAPLTASDFPKDKAPKTAEASI